VSFIHAYVGTCVNLSLILWDWYRLQCWGIWTCFNGRCRSQQVVCVCPKPPSWLPLV